MEEIERARDIKEPTLRPDEVSRPERFLRDLKENKWLERTTAGYNGFLVKLGNMVTGSGFAIGPEYLRQDLLGGNLTARGSAQISTRAYTKYELEIFWVLTEITEALTITGPDLTLRKTTVRITASRIRRWTASRSFSRRDT